MRLAALLLLLVTGTHYLYAPLSLLYEDSAFAARSIFYAARGFEGAALFVLLGLLVRKPLVGLVCAWGALEEAQTGICRIAAGLGSPVETSAFSGLCGVEMYSLGVIAAALLAAKISRGTK